MLPGRSRNSTQYGLSTCGRESKNSEVAIDVAVAFLGTGSSGDYQLASCFWLVFAPASSTKRTRLGWVGTCFVFHQNLSG
jgi:hypothetical protein